MDNAPTSLNKLKTKMDDLDVGELKTVPIKSLSDAVNNEVVIGTKISTLTTQVNKLDKKIIDVTTLTQINQYNTDKKIWRRKLEMLIKNKKYCRYWLTGLLFLIQKLKKLRAK